MDTECCVCFETYQKTGSKCPKLLPCVHTFCAQCLSRLIVNGKIKCPECRSWHPLSEEGVQTLPTNRRVLEYLNSLQKADNQQKDNNNNNDGIYTIPSSGIFNSLDICELHGQPIVMTRCDIDGPKQKLCEVCLDPQTIINLSSADFTDTESVISEIPRRIKFICTARVGDFTQNERSQTHHHHHCHLATSGDQELSVCNDIRSDIHDVTVPWGEASYPVQQHGCSRKNIVGIVLCLCIPFSVIGLFFIVIRLLPENL